MKIMPILLYSKNESGGSSTPSEYETYAGLPESPDAGTLAIVTGAGTEEMYEYVATVDGVSVGLWIPTRFSQKISGFVEDASSNKAYMDITGGDSHADLVSRGWAAVNDASGTSGVTDGYLYLKQQAPADAARMRFTPNGIPDHMLLYIETSVIESNTNDADLSGSILFADETSVVSVAYCLGDNKNRAGFVDLITHWPQIGAGYVDFTGYDPLFHEISMTGYRGECSQVIQPDVAESTANLDLKSSASNLIQLFNYNYFDNDAEFRVKRLFVFDLT